MRWNQGSDKTQFGPQIGPIGRVAACLKNYGALWRRSGAAGSVEAGIEAIRKILARSVLLARLGVGLLLITGWASQ
jgi:hypothetical protein